MDQEMHFKSTDLKKRSAGHQGQTLSLSCIPPSSDIRRRRRGTDLPMPKYSYLLLQLLSFASPRKCFHKVSF